MRDPRVRGGSGARGLLALAALLPACVAESVGYGDVRDMTASRIQKDVRWYEHDSASSAAKRVKQILSQPLDADAAVQLALLNNQRLQAAFEKLGIARGELVHALHPPNPSIDAALRFKRDTRADIDLQATEDLSELLFIPLRNGVAGAELDAAKVSVAGDILDLAFDVRVAFITYQGEARDLELKRTALEAVSASFDAARRLHEAGNITDLDFTSQQASYEETRAAYTRAQVALDLKRRRLNGLLGLWGDDTSWKTASQLAEPAPIDAILENLEQRALTRSLDLELIRARYTAAAKRSSLASVRGWVPDIKAGVSAERGDGKWGIGPAAALELPLFYQGQGESGSASAEARRQARLHADTAVQIRAEAQALTAKLKNAAENVQFYESTLLPLRKQVVSGAQLEYNAMSIGVFQLLEARRAELEAQQAYVRALEDYWAARAAVDTLLAGRLPHGAAGADGTDDGRAPLP